MEERNGVFISVYGGVWGLGVPLRVRGGIACACVRRRQAPPAVPRNPLCHVPPPELSAPQIRAKRI